MQHLIVQGLGFGDEGKGTITDALVRRHNAPLVVRYTGGSQCGHHVVCGWVGTRKEHCFSQVGAGSLAGAATYIGPHVKVDPVTLRHEIGALRTMNEPPTVYVDARAPIITVWHKALNRLRELARGNNRHGSCGMGIGELAADLVEDRAVLRWGDLPGYKKDLIDMIRMTKWLQAQKIMNDMPETDEAARLLGMLDTSADTWWNAVFDGIRHVGSARDFKSVLERLKIGSNETIVYEGAQGVLLDETHGFQPHTTWSDCTFTHALSLCREIGGEVTKIGVLRCFATRHGAGPLPTEIDPADVPPEWRIGEHNGTGPWQGAFRYGCFDAALARGAIDIVGGIDQLALTCVDRWPRGKPFIYVARSRQIVPFREAADPVTGVERALGRRVNIVSAGPTAADKTFVTERVAT